jgi:hypothetical protein
MSTPDFKPSSEPTTPSDTGMVGSPEQLAAAIDAVATAA